MEQQVRSIEQWLEDNTDNMIQEMPGKSVSEQLALYDAAGTGVGFVLVLQPEIGQCEDAEEIQGEIRVVGVPVVKICNKWYTITDEDLAEVVAAVLRIISRNVR